MDAEQINNVTRSGASTPPQPVEKKAVEGSSQPAQAKAETPSVESDTVSLSVEGKQALEGSGAAESKGTQNQQRNFDVTDNNQVILKIKDQETQQVVKQIPAEAEVRLRQAIQEGVESLDENV